MGEGCVGVCMGCERGCERGCGGDVIGPGRG